MRKKASNGSGTVRKRSDGRWEIMYYDDSGKRKSKYFKTQKEAESALREIEHAIETHTYADAGKMTLETWLNGWLDDYASVSEHPATEKAYRYRAAHVIRRIGHMKLSKLTMQDVQRFINGLKAEGLSPKTIFCIYGVFHCAMEQAVQNGLIAKNPTDYCKLPKVRAKEIIPLTDKQIGLMLEEIRKGEELGDPMFLALFTGMREAEICGLSWDAVDFSRIR